jgi:hypothetical protein
MICPVLVGMIIPWVVKSSVNCLATLVDSVIIPDRGFSLNSLNFLLVASIYAKKKQSKERILTPKYELAFISRDRKIFAAL